MASGWALVGLMGAEQSGYDGKLSVSTRADWLTGSESRELLNATLPVDSQTFAELGQAMGYGDMLIRMDARLFPPFNPVLAEIRDGRLTALLLASEADKSDDLVRTAALRYGIAVRRLT